MEMSSDASDSESSDTCVAVERIQAALRGHVARQMALHDLGRYVHVHIHVCMRMCVCMCVQYSVHVAMCSRLKKSLERFSYI